MEKGRDCQLFMTTADEKMFCKALRVFNPSIYFLDVKPSFEACIDDRLVTDVTRLDSDIFSIVNLDMISMEELSKCYKMRSGYYHFFQLGRAQMQFLRSAPDRNVEGCLQHGRIADSYKIVDKEERAWKNKVYAILKKIGQKVHWYYTLPDGTREISTKPENNLIAFPDAVVNYNGKSGNFMIHNRAMFVPQSIAVSELIDNPNLVGV